jgi:hypothetical protein
MTNKYTQPPRENKNATATSNPPVKTFRLGRIKAAVWENEATRSSTASPSPAPTWGSDSSWTIMERVPYLSLWNVDRYGTHRVRWHE